MGDGGFLKGRMWNLIQRQKVLLVWLRRYRGFCIACCFGCLLFEVFRVLPLWANVSSATFFLILTLHGHWLIQVNGEDMRKNEAELRRIGGL